MSYIDSKQLPLHFCPGCSHDLIVKSLDQALDRFKPKPEQTVIVTDIGCAGLTDKYFITNTFHGLHGRSITYGCGIKLANPNLNVIVLIGDGGCGIGGHHLINAARRNIGITVVVFNNFNFGMTGGQHSITTPQGGITSTTKAGNYEFPINICSTVSVNHASWVARISAYDRELVNVMVDALENDGFSLVDIWGMCTAYYMINNKLTRKKLSEMMDELNLEKGVLHVENREELGRFLNNPPPEMKKKDRRILLNKKFPCSINKKYSLILAGSAGQKIKSTATIFGRAGLLSGLYATQKDDYPVTVMSGFSVAEIIFDVNQINYTGISNPDSFILISEDGLKKKLKTIVSLGPGTRLYFNPDLELPPCNAKLYPLNFREQGLKLKKRQLPMAALAYVLKTENLFPMDALRESIRLSQREEIARENLTAIESF